MKLPKIFVPEKDLEGKVENLKSGVDDSLSLKDLILNNDYSDGLLQCNNINDSSIKESYSYFNLSEIEDIASLEYISQNDAVNTVYVNIVQFKDKFALEKDFKSVIGKHDQLDLISHNSTLIRNRYAIFVFMFSGNIHFKEKLVNVYKCEFGFEEIKAD